MEIMAMKLKQGEEDRARLKQNVLDQALQRMKFVLGPDATQEQIEYCCEPYLSLIDRYSGLVDDSRVEIDGLNSILED